eukprot:4353203-Pyramimonas_sp.AAC.1
MFCFFHNAPCTALVKHQAGSPPCLAPNHPGVTLAQNPNSHFNYDYNRCEQHTRFLSPSEHMVTYNMALRRLPQCKGARRVCHLLQRLTAIDSD